ncbi:hypothetical protein UlMin_033181 [Ulmus minor]
MIKTELGPNDTPIFQRIYVCLGAYKQGFLESYRPLVGVEGCHVKGPYIGQLLSVVGEDSNNFMFLIAYSIIEQENKDSWAWFLNLLMTDLEIDTGRGWTFISNRQKGLVQVLGELLPKAKHRFWEALRTKVWAAAKATIVAAFTTVMDWIKAIDVDAYEWLANKRPQEWSKSYFRDHGKCDVLLNNWYESFNGTDVLLQAREKPILSCFEHIQKYLMKRWSLQIIHVSKWFGELGDRVHKIIERNKLQSGWCHIISYGHSKFQIKYGMGGQFSVDLANKSCFCRA